MPGRKWYAIAFAIFVVAGVAAFGFVYTRLADLSRELPQVIVPGEATLTFTRPGTYTVYLERNSVVDGQLISTSDDISELRVRLTSPAGAPITLENPSMSSSYSIGGRSGEAVLSCEISEPGEYILAAGYPDGRDAPRGVLAIGLGVPGKILRLVLMTLGIVLTGFVAAVGLAAATFWKRRKMTRAMPVVPPVTHA